MDFKRLCLIWLLCGITAAWGMQDMVTSITHPLMVSPQHGTSIQTKADWGVAFKWNEPSRELHYFLQIYEPRLGKLLKTYKVSNGKAIIPIAKLPSRFYWRVVAKSPGGKLSRNWQLFLVNLVDKKPIPKTSYALTPPPAYILHVGAGQSKVSFKHDYENSHYTGLKSEAKFSGPFIVLGGEYLFKRWNRRRSLSADYSVQSYSNGRNELTMQRMAGEFGWLGNIRSKSSHNFYAGFARYATHFALGPDLSATYVSNYLSGRHLFIKHLDEDFVLSLNSSIMMPVPSLAFPSLIFKPILSYKYSTQTWFDLFGSFERIVGKPLLNEAGDKSQVKTVIQNITLGVGLTFLLGK